MEIMIHRLREQDVEPVSRIEAASFSMPWSPKDFAELVGAPGALYLVAEVNGQTVGCCGVTDISGEGDINNVVVDEACRGQGIAQALLKELLRQGEEMGIRDFTLEVRVSNAPAIHVYEKLGFVSEGIRPGFYDKPKEDAMIMWRRKGDVPPKEQ